MDYREHPTPPELAGLVKTFWTLDAGGAPGDWIAQQAVPDGCVEIIRRLAGRSRWDGDQAECFAVGLIDTSQGFSVSGDSRFAGIRLWPWAWPLVSALPIADLWGRWQPHDSPLADALPDFARAGAVLGAQPRLAAIGRAILDAGTVAEMDAAGMSPRTLQRWFALNVGMPPRRYLRLLRFHKAFERLPDESRLADHAAAQGYADQAHMARDFREIAGVPAKQARRTAKGPFLT